MMDFLYVYYKKIINDVMNCFVLHFYADIKRKNSNSRTFSRNVHFEVTYLENGLADYSDRLEFLKFSRMRATCTFFLVALLLAI